MLGIKIQQLCLSANVSISLHFRVILCSVGDVIISSMRAIYQLWNILGNKGSISQLWNSVGTSLYVWSSGVYMYI